MAVLAVAAAGAWAGSAAFGAGSVLFGMSGAQLGWMAGSMLGNALFAPTQKGQGPRLGDLTVSGSAYGQPIPYVAGHPRVAGQVIWASAKREIATTQSAGGKGGGGSEYTSYTYEVDLLLELSDNEIAGVSRVWKNGELVYSILSDADPATIDSSINNGGWSRMTVYTGAAAQLPDPDYEAAVGTANAPAYRGRGTVFIKSLQLGSGGQIPNLTFEVCTNATYITYNQGFLLRFDHPETPNTYTDETGKTWAIYGGAPASDVAISDVQSKWGGGSLKVSMSTGTANTILSSFAGIAPAQNKFSIQCWFYSDGTYIDSQTYIADLLNTAGSEFSLIHNPLRGGLLAKFHGQTAITYAPSYNAWHFVEYNYDGTTRRLFVDGVLRASQVVAPGAQVTFNGAQVGVVTGIASSWKDYIDDLRVTFGVARNSSVPTGPMVNDLCTTLMTALPDTLQDTVDGILAMAGPSSSQYDTTALSAITRPVRAMAVSQVSTARTVLEMLASAYHFDCVLSDKLYFRPRGAAPAATLTFDEFGVSVDASTSADPLPLMMANELEIPAQIAISFANVDNDYQTDTQYSDRLLTGQESTSAISLPLGLTASEGKQIADAVLLDKAVSALSTSVAVGITRASLEPGDVLMLTGDDASTYRMRITKRTEAAGVITLGCVADDASVWTQAGVTDASDSGQTTVLPTPTTDFVLLDIPLLRDVDNLPGFYLAVEGSAANWSNCAVYTSLDDLTYTQVTTMADQTAIGTCTTTLGNWTGGNVFDETNTVTVNVGAIPQLASVTRDDILTNQSLNAALIGSELIQYRTATLVSTGVYTLSGLLRGRRGTEWASTGHAASERFVLLSTSGLRYLALQSGDLGSARYYKVASAGQRLSGVTAQSITPAGVALECLSPVNARANRTTTDTVLTWTRRTRLSTRLTGTLPISAPLGETTEAYEVEVWDATYTTLKRTLAAASPTATYTSAQQVSDFGSDQTTLYLKIYQLSATVGRGYPLTVSI